MKPKQLFFRNSYHITCIQTLARNVKCRTTYIFGYSAVLRTIHHEVFYKRGNDEFVLFDDTCRYNIFTHKASYNHADMDVDIKDVLERSIKNINSKYQYNFNVNLNNLYNALLERLSLSLIILAGV